MLVEAGLPQHGSFQGRGGEEGHLSPPPHLGAIATLHEKSRMMLQSVKEQLSDFLVSYFMSPPAIEDPLFSHSGDNSFTISTMT